MPDQNPGEGNAGEGKETPPTNQQQEHSGEPQVRKTPQDFIIDRQKETIEKLREERVRKPEGDSGDDAGGDEDDDNELTPEAEAAISREVGRRLAPYAEHLGSDRDAQEVGDFVRDNPDFASYQELASKYRAHEAYRRVPTKFIFQALAYEDAVREGAERERDARTRAEGSRTGGSPVRQSGGALPDFRSMSNEEFSKYVEKVKRGANP